MSKMLLKRAYTYRLYPTKKQREKLQWTLDLVRELYNAALQERRDAWRMAQVSIHYEQQSDQLPEIKNVREEYKEIYSQVLQDVLRRVKKAFDGFFRRVKEGKTPGYPRFKGHDRFDSFCYPRSGFSVTQDQRICLSKIGTIKVKLHRELEGTPKTCTIKREGEHWFVILTCDVEQDVLYPASEAAVGIDLGLLHFATLSDGSTIENPRYLRQAQAKLTRAQRRIATKQRGSKRRKKAGKLVGKVHRKVRNQRKDFLHKASRNLVKSYGTIVFEALAPGNMSRRPKPKHDAETGQSLPNGASAKSGLNKSIRDAGWGQFVQQCQNKAEEAGSRVLLVDPRYTSQPVVAVGPSNPRRCRSGGIPALVARNWTAITMRPSTSCGLAFQAKRCRRNSHGQRRKPRLGLSLQRTRL